jgi:hypothetical protein
VSSAAGYQPPPHAVLLAAGELSRYDAQLISGVQIIVAKAAAD